MAQKEQNVLNSKIVQKPTQNWWTHKTNMDSTILGNGGIKNWSPFVGFGTRSAIFCHLKTGANTLEPGHIMEIEFLNEPYCACHCSSRNPLHLLHPYLTIKLHFLHTFDSFIVYQRHGPKVFAAMRQPFCIEVKISPDVEHRVELCFFKLQTSNTQYLRMICLRPTESWT